MTLDLKALGNMGTSIRKVANFVRSSDDELSDKKSASLPNSEGSLRLGDRLQGSLEDVSVDSVKVVRDIRERE